MKGSHRTSEFFGAYYFSDIIANVLEDPLEYMQGLEAFCDGDAAQTFLTPFPKWSALHRFAAFMIGDLFWETDVVNYKKPTERQVHWERFMAEVGEEPGGLWIERAFRRHGIEFEPFTNWNRDPEELEEDVLFDWYRELKLSVEYDKLVTHLSTDVFTILFANRKVLLDLNQLIAQDLVSAGVDDEDYLPFATQDGRAKRQPVPQWASRAVFYRDRGRCCFCRRDLTGLLSPQFAKHLDHIVPLAEGGINDVTNLQLLCETCNTRKGGRSAATSAIYETWYDERDRPRRIALPQPGRP